MNEWCVLRRRPGSFVLVWLGRAIKTCGAIELRRDYVMLPGF